MNIYIAVVAFQSVISIRLGCRVELVQQDWHQKTCMCLTSQILISLDGTGMLCLLLGELASYRIAALVRTMDCEQQPTLPLTTHSLHAEYL